MLPKRAPDAPAITAATGAAPAGGAPTNGSRMGVSVPAGASAPSPVLPPGVIEGVAGGPPEPAAPPEGLRTTANLAQQLREELVGVKLNGPVVLFGDTLYVEYQDKNRVQRRVGHHPDLKVVVKGRRGQNVPAHATVVADKQKEL